MELLLFNYGWEVIGMSENNILLLNVLILFLVVQCQRIVVITKENPRFLMVRWERNQEVPCCEVGVVHQKK